MGAPAWTKGPWRVDPHHSGDVQTSDGTVEIGATWHASDQGSSLIIRGPNLPDDDTADANARLIASAPDLAEALEKAAEHLDRAGMVTFRDGEISQSFLDAAEAARLALSKARGETE